MQRRPRDEQRHSEAAAVLVVAVCGLLRACGAANRCSPRQRFQKDESTTCTVGALRNKQYRRLVQAVFASVLLAASAHSCAGHSDTNDSYQTPDEASVRTPATQRDRTSFAGVQ